MALYLIINAILGLVFGSFATMAIHRLNEHESFFGRSKCPSCGTKLGLLDLFPILSYASLGGKCRYCKATISNTYPIIEFLGCIFFILNAILLQHDIHAMIIFQIFSVFLIIISFCDIKSMHIPDTLLYYFAGFCLIFSYFMYHDIIQILFMPIIMLTIGVVIKATTEFFLDKKALGDADIKIFTITGLLLGPENVSSFLILTGLIGLLFGVIYKRTYGGTYFPFAPAICISLYTTIILKFDISYMLNL